MSRPSRPPAMELHQTKRKSLADSGPDHKKRNGRESDGSEDLFDDDIGSDFSEFESDGPSIETSSSDSGKGSEMAGGDDSCYGLPADMRQLLKKYRHIDQLYEWQDRLMRKLLQDNRNFIYCVPTSGGKTLVAELMLMRELLLNRRDAVLVLPYISIVQEKLRALRPFAESLRFVVEEYAGGRGSVPIKKRRSMRTIYLCTIEKANVVITSLFEADRLQEIGLFVIDELHMIGDGTARGVTLETLIVKTKLAAAKSSASIRFLGMSATLTNFPDLSRFLDAEVIRDNFRPVQLKEFVKFGAHLYDASKVISGHRYEDMPVERELPGKEVIEDPENLRTLVGEVIPAKSVLIFCPTKKHCENVAHNLSRLLPNRSLLLKHKQTEKERLVRCILQSNGGAMCNVLRKTLPFGIAYHHSGLTPDERQMIEEAFSKQVISCIVCTSTLAAGVNLPAERVIIREPYIGREFISKAQYQQICGRAGRAGLCEFGESILIGSRKDSPRIKKLLETALPSCMSALKNVENGLSAFILTLLRLKLASNTEQLNHIITTETLCGIQYLKEPLISQVSSCVTQLMSLSLISVDETTGTFRVSDIGNGVVRSLIDVTKSLTIFEELKRAQSAISLSNYLHLIYLTTLLMEERDLPFAPDSQAFLEAYSELKEDEQKSAELFGLHLGVISSYLRPDAKPNVRIRRLYVTLIVYEVWNRRTDLSVVANKYDADGSASSSDINDLVCRHNMQRGTLYALLGQAASSANSLLRFVEEMKDQLWSFQCLLPAVCEALTFCCAPELMPLMQLNELRIPRARQLYAAGFTDIISIAKLTSPSELTQKIDRLTTHQAASLIRAARHAAISQKDELLQQVSEMRVPIAEQAGDVNPAEDSFLQNFDV